MISIRIDAVTRVWCLDSMIVVWYAQCMIRLGLARLRIHSPIHHYYQNVEVQAWFLDSMFTYQLTDEKRCVKCVMILTKKCPRSYFPESDFDPVVFLYLHIVTQRRKAKKESMWEEKWMNRVENKGMCVLNRTQRTQGKSYKTWIIDTTLHSE